MVRTLEFMGQPGPWRDIKKFVAAVKAASPHLDDAQIMAVVHRENARKRPRHTRQRFHVFGADILSNDLQSMDAWPYLHDIWKRDLPMYPLEGGRHIRSTDEDAPVHLQTAIASHSAHQVNRRTLLVPEGLSKTYVWCQANNWMQDVADADVVILRNTPILNLMFRDPSLASGPLQIQGYQRLSTGEKYQFNSADEAQAFERDMTSRPQWKGV